MLLYIIGFAIHLWIFLHNRKTKRPFRLQIFLIYVCFFRIVTLSLRMAWATHNTDVGVVIAAQVFVTAGVILLFVLDLLLALRLLRAMHPNLGWHPAVGRLFVAYYVLVGLSLVSVITCFIQSLYTLDPYTRQVDHAMILYGGTFFLVAAFFPVPFVAACYIGFWVKRVEEQDSVQGQDAEKRVDERGPSQRPCMEGSVAHGGFILIAGALLLSLGAGFRTGVAYSPARPATDPAWYDSKACFYVFDFVTELAVLYLYAVARVDKIFYVSAFELEIQTSAEAA
jgi:hypothetical protein